MTILTEIFESKDWKTVVAKIVQGQEERALKAVGGGAVWTDNLGRPIGIAFGGNLGKGRHYAKYGHYAMAQLDKTTGEVKVSAEMEATITYMRRQWARKGMK